MTQKLITLTVPAAGGVTDFADELKPYFEEGYSVKQFTSQTHIPSAEARGLAMIRHIVTVLLEKEDEQSNPFPSDVI